MILCDLFTAIGLFLCFFTVGVAGQCPENWQYNEGLCYGYSNIVLTWADAASVCQAQRARLAEPRNAQQQNFIQQLAKSKGAERAWIGVTDLFRKGTWAWGSTGGNIGSFTAWYTGEPNNYEGKENCLEIWVQFNYKWNDHDCSKLSPFICEKRSLN